MGKIHNLKDMIPSVRGKVFLRTRTHGYIKIHKLLTHE